MVAGLGAVLDRLQGLLGKGYLLAGFVPVLVFVTASAVLSYYISPRTRAWMAQVEAQPAMGLVPYWFGILLSTALLGFVFWSLNPWLREFLEGRHLVPRFIRNYMEAFQQAERDRLEGATRGLTLELVRLRKAVRNEKYASAALKSARLEGDRNPRSLLSSELLRTNSRLKLRRLLRWRIRYQDLKHLGALLLRDLRAKPAGQIEMLDTMQVGYRELVNYALEKVEGTYSRLRAEKKFRFPDKTGTLGATSMGNMAELHRDYARARYGMDIDVFWLRMQKLIKKDDNFYPILEESKTQLDFSVAMTSVSALFTVLWSVILLIAGTSPWPYYLVFGIGFPATVLFYWMSVRNYRSFGEALRSAVDLYRFELLKALHVELPADSGEEPRLWKELTQLAKARAGSVEYKHE